MDLADQLTIKYFGRSGSELLVGGVPITKLANDYGTPLFVYDRATIDRKLNELRAALPSHFSVYYSIKANPNSAILKHLLKRGCGLEIASAGEYAAALQAGCQPQRILFAGPGKTESELKFVLSSGIGEIHLESLTELKRASMLAHRLNKKINVAIRVNPMSEAEGGAMRMGGRPAPFGVDEESLEGVIDAVLKEDLLEFCGIHMFSGTQILDSKVLINQYRHALEIARRVVRYSGRPIRTLDFGGGLGIPYFAQDCELNLHDLGAGLSALFGQVAEDPAFKNTQFIVEPGRFLVGESGMYVTRINDIKISRGQKYLILDGGMHHHLAASGNLGQTIKRNYPAALVNKLGFPAEETVDVIGPLCTPLDKIARGATLPRAEIGDLFGIFQSGAYGRSASPLGFLSHPAPPEVWIDSGVALLVRCRGDYEGVSKNQTTLEASLFPQ